MFSDVPDAPVDLVLSEYKSRSVHLTWVPGNDHNSPVTGKKRDTPFNLALFTCGTTRREISQFDQSSNGKIAPS